MQVKVKVGADVAPQGSHPGITVVAGDGNAQVLRIPTSHDEMLALLTQRSALNDQLEQANERRSDLMDQMRSAPADALPGLRVQMTELTDQIVQLQRDLNVVGREISQAPPALVAMAQERPPDEDEPHNFQEGVFLGAAGMFLGLTTLLLLGRWIWKRFIREDVPHPRMLPSADSERLQRVEQGIEAMAIEVERISEGQRFVTKLISESRGLESTPR